MRKISPGILACILIAVIGGLAYLPWVSKFGYSYDDWYLMYAAKAYGSQAFHLIFSVDRPLRAYVMIPAYALFGEEPLGYNLSAYVFRCLGGMAFWWLLKMLWPKAGQAAVMAALLFVVYPGFLSQPNAIDYQSHIVALCLAVISLALTVRFFFARRSVERAITLGGALLSGWAYLGLMEYYIGFELIRFTLLLLLSLRARLDWMQRLKQFLVWLPFALIAGLFLVWRTFIFVGERKATDAGIQFGPFLADPMQTLAQWAASLFQDVLDVVLWAWVTPLRQLLPRMDSWQIISGCALGLLAALLALLIYSLSDNDPDRTWRKEAFSLGMASVMAGLVPVVLANRTVAFPHFSRYTLISSTGAALLFTALISWLPRKTLNAGLFALLIFAAVLTHFSNASRYVRETASMNSFWWQVAWRVPQLERNTTVIAHYQVVSPQEDYFVWGPANLIYFPEKVAPDHIQPGIYSALPNDSTVEKVLAKTGQVYYTRRTIITYANYRNILILTQPSPESCVQIIDGRRPELSSFETDRFIKMAPFSEIDHVLVDDPAHVPPAVVFGPEPARGWCYYFEKASLARQGGDWKEIVRLAQEARSRELFPHDQVEWLPFLQGWAMEGQVQQLADINARITDPLVRRQACRLPHGMDALPPDIRTQFTRLFCGDPVSQ